MDIERLGGKCATQHCSFTASLRDPVSKIHTLASAETLSSAAASVAEPWHMARLAGCSITLALLHLTALKLVRLYEPTQAMAAMENSRMKLSYFDARGVAETTRYMLAVTKTPYEDFRYVTLMPSSRLTEFRP